MLKTTKSLDLEAAVNAIMGQLWENNLPRHIARLEVERALVRYAQYELEDMEEKMKKIFAESEAKEFRRVATT